MLTNREKLAAQAQKYVEKGQYDKAIREYQKIVAEDEKDVRTWLKIGDLYVKMSLKAEAAQTYQKVAQFYADQGFYLKAVAVYKQILKIDGRLIEVNIALAELYRQLGLLADAVSQYESVAAFLLREGRAREALAAHRAILDLDPDNLAQRIKLAELYSKEEMVVEAAREFGHTAQQLKALGRMDDYLKVAERLLYHEPENRAVAKELAALYIERGDARRALTKLQISFKANPRDMETLDLLAKAFARLGQSSKSVQVLKEMARLAAEQGQAALLRECHQRILSVNPADAESRAALGLQPVPGQGVPGPPPAPPPPPAIPPAMAAMPVAPVVVAPPPVGPPPLPPPAPGVVSAAQEGSASLRIEVQRGRGAAPSAVPKGEPLHDDAVARVVTEADVYAKYGLYQKAVDHLLRALDRQPTLREVRERLYELYELLGQPQAAITQLWELVEQAPTREDAARYLGEVLRIDPDNREAVLRWREIRVAAVGEDQAAAEEAADAGSLRDDLVEVDFFLQQSMLTEARRLLSSLMERDPDNAQLLARQRRLDSELTRAPERRSVTDGGRSVYEATRQGVRERGAPSGDANQSFELGLAYRESGLYTDAVQEFRKALHSARLEAQSRLMIGVCYLDLERPTEAQAELLRALSVPGLSPQEGAEAHYQLGRAQEALGNAAEALRSYEQAVQKDGAHKAARERQQALAQGRRR